jgi:hypothetical protein
MDLEIDVNRLKNIANSLFDRLLKTNSIVHLKYDEYWIVQPSDRYDFSKTPGELGVGKLTDDWELLQSLIDDSDDAVPYMFVHLAPLVEAIAEAALPRQSEG